MPYQLCLFKRYSNSSYSKERRVGNGFHLGFFQQFCLPICDLGCRVTELGARILQKKNAGCFGLSRQDLLLTCVSPMGKWKICLLVITLWLPFSLQYIHSAGIIHRVSSCALLLCFYFCSLREAWLSQKVNSFSHSLERHLTKSLGLKFSLN